MQQLAIEVLCKELVRIGILVGDINLLIEQNVPCAFYYHGKLIHLLYYCDTETSIKGLGHTLGLDVHDVGG
jgi:Xaa-Pro dipeptidase